MPWVLQKKETVEVGGKIQLIGRAEILLLLEMVEQSVKVILGNYHTLDSAPHFAIT